MNREPSRISDISKKIGYACNGGIATTTLLNNLMTSAPGVVLA